MQTTTASCMQCSPGGQTALGDCMPPLIAKRAMRFPAIDFHFTTRLTADPAAGFGYAGIGRGNARKALPDLSIK